MENTTNQQHEPNEPHGPNRPAEESAGPQAKSQTEAPKGGFDSIFCAMREAADDAKSAAGKAIPKVKSAASDAAYWITYGASFAAVFQWTVAKNLAPQSLKKGYRDGAKAGRESAEAWIEKRKQRSETSSAASTIHPDECPEQAQPGAA